MFSGVADLKKVFDKARMARRMGRKTLLFVDEIHRFNRAQQDGFLPVMEDGTVVLVGATTENPSFELNAALLSRAQVLRFEFLQPGRSGAAGASAPRRCWAPNCRSTTRRGPDCYELADGDGRAMLGLVEEVFAATKPGEVLDKAALLQVVQRRAPIYDKKQDGHYNLISALHKTVRGSDPDARALLFRPHARCRRGPAVSRPPPDPHGSRGHRHGRPAGAALQAIAARDAYQMLGSPEGELALAQAVVYLASAPKSNAVYTAFAAATELAKQHRLPDAPDGHPQRPDQADEGAGLRRGYIYDHDTPEGFSGQEYFPEKLGRQNFYQPVERGFEREIKKRLEYFARLRSKKAEDQG